MLKAEGARASRESRQIEPVQRADQQRFLDGLEARGVEVVESFSFLPAARVRLEGVNIGEVMALPFVDFIAPDQPMDAHAIYGEGASSSAVLAESVDWGPMLVHAPDVWNTDWPRTIGSGATITVIDSGLDSVHFVSGDGPDLIKAGIVSAHNAGVLLVASAGNNGTGGITYPAAFSEVIAVTGSTPTDGFAGPGTCPVDPPAFSRQGSQAELSAPWWATSMLGNGTFGIICGTSMAAPVVAAVGALVWSEWPSMTRDQVRERLRSTAIDLGATGWDSQFGHGRVDAARAVWGILGVGINGPSGGTGQQVWVASVTNPGPTNPHYSWEKRWFCEPNFFPVGTDSGSYTDVITSGNPFFLRVTVTSAGRSAASSKLIGGFGTC